MELEIILLPAEKKENGKETHQMKKYFLGILLGIGGAVGQALAMVTAKKGLMGDFPALSANLIRIIVATAIFWIIPLCRGTVISNFHFSQNKKARWSILSGSLVGPFLGIWLSLIAIKYAHIGIL